MNCALAADTKVETPEGALTIKSLASKAAPVFTREASGRVRFRMLENIVKVADQQPVIKITLENGQAFRVAGSQVLFKAGMVETRAEALVGDDLLEAAFSFPAGYEFRDDRDGGTRQSVAAWRVAKVEPAGNADLYSFGVSKTGTFFLSAGVLAKADGSGDN